MIDAAIWYLLVSIAGWLTLPLAQRLFRFLPDRGYTLSRPLAMLLWGYLFWLLTYLHVLQNNAGGVLLAIFILAGLSLVFGRQKLTDLWSWIKEQRRLVIITELLFLLAFAAWAFVRAANPEVNYTEKPMELAFINAIERSPGFPPNDPWLSGYAISYYYFGYIMVAMLVHLSGTVTSVAFNLAVAMWFALTAVAAYGILYNLLAKRAKSDERSRPGWAVSWALLAPLFILIVSNLSGFLDILHARGLFWAAGTDGQLQSNFWTWLNIRDINQPPQQPFSWIPQRGGWLWWTGSRVLQDFSISGATLEVIDEFPFFSYLLADLHPHVLGMPFVLLAIGVGLNLAYRGITEKIEGINVGAWLKSFDFWPTAIILGGLAFLNTWDFPIYVALVSGVYIWLRTLQSGWSRQRVGEFIKLGLLLGIAGVVLYLPFYIGFSSQAGGLLPSLAYHTRGVYFLVMFLPLLLPIVGWLVVRMFGRETRQDLKIGLIVSAGLVVALWVLMFLVGGVFQASVSLGTNWQNSSNLGLQDIGNRLVNALTEFFSRQGAQGAELFQAALLRRVTDPLTWLILLFVIALGWGLLSFTRRKAVSNAEDAVEAIEFNFAETTKLRIDEGFVALLVLVGAGMVLLPEFFYLKDGFGTRMNTIFKFYFQAWIVWGLAAAYASAVLWQQLRGAGKILFRVGWSLMLIAALCYPAIMLYAKTGLPGKPLSELTLDGKQYLQKYSPEEWAAFEWLKEAPAGVVAETVGASYNPDTSRVSTHSGQQTVLGWQGHEWQWRGGVEEIGSRATDLELLYSTDRWDEAEQVCARYNIRYIYIGPVERVNYRVSEGKFQANLPVVYQNNAVTIYEVPGYNPLPQPGSELLIP